jgi:hypothetical protein
MTDTPGDPFPLPNSSDEDPNSKLWTQNVAPGSRAGGGAAGPANPAEAERQAQADLRLNGKLGRASVRLEPYQLNEVIDAQTQLLHYPLFGRQSAASGTSALRGADNAEVWHWFLDEKLFDTRRLTLEHFHLFEWFPLTPGRFHTYEGRGHRQAAEADLRRTADGRTYYLPHGKAAMVAGGIGAVRLRPRAVSGEPHYFLTASSSGVCHEGFPVLVPRRFYGPLKERMAADGAAPVTVRGEMRYIDGDTPAYFSSRRDLPGLYLHVDEVELLPAPRAEVTRFLVSVAVAFLGTFQGQEGRYVTYCSFDPASRPDLGRAVEWISQFYVAEQHQGVVITDFDETREHFPGAVFGLPGLLSGNLDPARAQQVLSEQGISPQAGQNFFIFYRQINTRGGNYYEGPVTVNQGDFHG